MSHGVALVTLALLSALGARADAQSQRPPAGGPRRGVSVFVGGGLTNLAGGVSKGGQAGLGLIGVAVERPVSPHVALRAELLATGGAADLGLTGPFDQPTTLSVVQWGLNAGARRYGSHGTFLGAGASVTSVSVCDVDTEGGPGFLGGETVNCADSDDPALSKGSSVAAINLSAGVRRGNVELEARFDQGLQASVQSAEGAMRLRTVNLVLHVRFGH